MNISKTQKYLFLLIGISVLIRGLIAHFIEFGNDEVYYWTYALYPDWSHFDHPSMVGWVIQFFTLNLFFESEFFIRLGSLVFGAVNTYLIFLIAKQIYDEKAGLIAALLYNSSIYCFAIAGIFILPDTPQSLFWMLSVYLLIKTVSPDIPFSMQKNYLMLTAVVLGLGMLSKYTTVFVWVGIGLYVLLCDRKWFKSWQLYASVLISLIFVLPILIWNIQNDFISFTFHSERVDASGSVLRLDYFAKELFGQVVYNNPVLFVLTVVALIAVFKKKLQIAKTYSQILILTSLPLILLFLFFSLFRSTLPHWTSPAYMTLLVFPAVYLAKKYPSKVLSWPIITSMGILVIGLSFGILQIQTGIFKLDNYTEEKSLGKHDFSLDMYGWKQIADGMEKVLINDISDGIVGEDVVLLSKKWFPAAHLDYYVARPLDMRLLSIGTLDQIHKYAWINNYRGGFQLDMDAYYITTSHFNRPPAELEQYFESTVLHHKIPIYRSGKIVQYAFVYLMNDLKKIPDIQITR